MRTLSRLVLAGLLVAAAFAAIAPSSTAHHCDPREPDCKHEQQDQKDPCHWTLVGGPRNPVTFGAAPGNQLLTLHCPNHILVNVDYGYKDCSAPIGDPKCDVPLHLLVTDLGATPTLGTACGWSHNWAIYAPNANIYQVYFRATTWKDADCDGAPDDWNAEFADPTGAAGACYWQNYFGPKPQDHPPGMFWPYTAAPYGPMPDGSITACDQQIYEIQWRQFN